MACMTPSALIQAMTSSYLNKMFDVTGVNVFPRKLMKFPHKEKVNSVPYPTLYCFFPDSFKKCSTFWMSKESKSRSKCLAKVILSPTKEQLIVSFIDFEEE